jgi:FkbM family methyltransferase
MPIGFAPQVTNCFTAVARQWIEEVYTQVMPLVFLFKRIKVTAIRSLKYLFRKLGIGITSYANLVNLQKKSSDTSLQDLEFIRALGPAHYESIITLLSNSRSQLRQDLFVLSEVGYKKNGYFVEFGAANGFDLSNTYLLETEFSWTGILAEPAREWQKRLKVNRPNSSIEALCVWKDSNSNLMFNETDSLELSTIDIFSDRDGHANARSAGRKYEVQTISLNELLIKCQAPKYIDYLSVDTEGSEYEILKAFSFDEFNIGIITVEHNYTPQREKIFALLTRHGYKRKYEHVSAFDDWYVKS